MPAPKRTRGPQANPKAAIGDWLNLVDPDGAFLTTTELSAAFPHGFEPLPAVQRADLRSLVADTESDAAGRAELRRWLLTDVLDWDELFAEDQRLPATSQVRAAEHGAILRPSHALLDVDDPNKVRVGVFVWPPGTRLDRRTDATTAGDTWPASPLQRAETWCRESGVPLALVTDDDQWALVWAPRGAPAASCRWRIADLADERILQAGFVSLLGARRFFAVGEDETLERLFERAADAETEITKGLGSSVRRSVELLVAAISRDDVASNGRVLDGVAATEVYEASVTVLMRLVFLLFAEERRLLPAEDPLWAESYSVLSLRDDLRSAQIRDGEDALERRSTAWHRLLATFRAVHSGANHDRLTLPAYGGSLFDPERFPFLEGRRTPDHVHAAGIDLGPAEDAAIGPGRPIAIDDRTVLAILDALLNIKVRSGRSTVTQRVSYKALDVEQIGHCYEGLLDHSAVRIDVLSLGLIGPEGAEPEFSITDLEERLARGPEALCEWLADKERCNKKASALAKDLDRQPEGVDLARLRVACGHDDDTVARVLPFWGLIRSDLRGLPVVLLPGSQFVTQTSTRRNMGAQYTTKALAEEVARHALEPLVYDPGPQNEADPEKWKLRTPAAILDLRICDPAVGSGAILTAAGRYLADRLIESVVEHGPGEGPFATRLADLARASADEQVVMARREIVDHCLYGVDKNPVAAEMAKLSLWLTTMARERPFTFLDHAIQVGDALLGITDIEQLRWLHLDPAERKGKAGFATLTLDTRIKEASDLARRLQDLSVITVRDATEKQRLHEELRAKLTDLSVVADTVVGAAVSTAGKRGASMEQRLDSQAERIRSAVEDDRSEPERAAALGVLHDVATGWLRTDLPDDPPMPWSRRCMHWPLAFPEVFLGGARGGFDTVLGNPPFLGVTKIEASLGASYREMIHHFIQGGEAARADLVVFFLLRAAVLVHDLGTVGLIGTQTIAQAGTRRVGLDRLLGEGFIIYRASKGRQWPGEATVSVALLWLASGEHWGQAILDGTRVNAIDGGLEVASRSSWRQQRLVDQPLTASQGVMLLGSGFVVAARDAESLLRGDPKASGVLKPFVSGEDVNSAPNHRSSRFVIDFGSMDLAEAAQYGELLEIVRSKVKPVRDANKHRERREKWWMFGGRAEGIRTRIAPLDNVVVIAKVSKTAIPVLVHNDSVFSDKVIIFSTDSFSDLAILSSAHHYWWAIQTCGTLREDLSYSPYDCLDTFPFPVLRPSTAAGAVGSALSESKIQLEGLGASLHKFRAEVLKSSNAGLTKTYNRLHDPSERNSDIERLRQLHVELDHGVRDAYGWHDLALNHHHWETPQGMRFTVSPEAKDELLDRLLELNHERYAAEVAAGLHDRKAKRASVKRKPKAADDAQWSML